ncbi:MAG: cation transporter [Nevskia sp.]|nr:cation transporter [Nevskia sp.]
MAAAAGHAPQHGAHDHGHGHGHGHDGHDHDHGSHGPGRAHGHGHSHDHRHYGSGNERRLIWALALTAGFMLVEVAGGLISGSLALLADAAHMLTDAASLMLALLAVRVSRRPADETYSYGHHRYEVLAAFVNGLALLVLGAWILGEAVHRLLAPQPVQGGLMLWVAIIGGLANLACFLVLRGGHDSINLRGALMHVLYDLLGSVAAVAAAVVIIFSHWTPVDPLLSALLSVLIVRGGWSLARQSAHILAEGTPPGLDPAEVASDLVAGIAAVRGIHHLHVWSLTDARPVMTLHAVLEDSADQGAALAAIQERLREHFGVAHATVQIERASCEPGPDACHDHAVLDTAAVRKP